MNKKLLPALVLPSIVSGLMLSTTAQADFFRVHVGGGAWINQLNGDLSSSISGDVNVDDLGTDTQTKGYLWAYFKHPVPLVPNVRLEYMNIGFDGTANQSFDFKGKSYGVSANSSIDMTQYDVIAYYNLLDNTFWATLDLGIDVKALQFDFKANSSATNSSVTESESVFLPMLYGRVRAELPTTDIGLEANVKYVAYDGDSLIDYTVKVDYTLAELLPVDLALEVGYRKQQFEVEGGGYSVDLSIDGVFAGLAIKF